MRGGSVEAGLADGDDLPCGALEAIVCGLQAALGEGDAEGGVLTAEAGFECGEALGWSMEAALSGSFKAEAQLVDALVAAVDGVAEAGENGLGREPGIALTGVSAHRVTPRGGDAGGLILGYGRLRASAADAAAQRLAVALDEVRR